MRLPHLAAIAALAASLAFASPRIASAQDAREQARLSFEEASRQFEAGNHQLALQGFERARELVSDDPRASALILFNIARCHEELGRDAEALAVFERYLIESPADGPFREETQDRVRELRARIEAETVDGPGSSPAPAEPADSPLPLVGGIVLAVGGAVALASIAPGVMALDGASHLEQACPGGACPAEEASRIDETHTLGVVTDVLWATGLGIAAVGAVLLVVGITSGGGAEDTQASLSPSLECTTSGCVGGIVGRY